jgi:hypothetical protein
VGYQRSASKTHLQRGFPGSFPQEGWRCWSKRSARHCRSCSENWLNSCVITHQTAITKLLKLFIIQGVLSYGKLVFVLADHSRVSFSLDLARTIVPSCHALERGRLLVIDFVKAALLFEGITPVLVLSGNLISCNLNCN